MTFIRSRHHLVKVVFVAIVALIGVLLYLAPKSTGEAPVTTLVAAKAPAHFTTSGVRAALPSDAQCAAWVKSVASRENKRVNARANATRGKAMRGASGLNARVTGNFTGTTEQVLRWTACKWGIDENIVKAQAAIESWWRMDTKGDWGTTASRCAPGHRIGSDGVRGKCPESIGLLQVRYPFNKPAFPYAGTSSAFNADYAYAQWRSCYQGNTTWLNTISGGAHYAAGDAWGCVGLWFSGRWHNAGANGYINRVKGYLNQKIWTTKNFQQP